MHLPTFILSNKLTISIITKSYKNEKVLLHFPFAAFCKYCMGTKQKPELQGFRKVLQPVDFR